MATSSFIAPAPTAAQKPVGGYRILTPLQICMVWQAYRMGILPKFYDLRAYLALHEWQGRRDAATRSRHRRSQPRRRNRLVFDSLVAEVAAIMHSKAGRFLRASLRRLERAGLIQISAFGILFDKTPQRMPFKDCSKLQTMLDELAPARKKVRPWLLSRSVPVPRSMLRYIAAGCPASHAATMFGTTIRCLFLHTESGCNAEGSCSTAFVARLFGVHPRTVKRARHDLIELGWLMPLSADHWHVQAHGSRVRINLQWIHGQSVEKARVESDLRATESPPRTDSGATKLPPPTKNQYLPTGTNNQNPVSSGPAGVKKPTTLIGKARWSHVVVSDLTDSLRLEALFQQAVGFGLVTPSDADHLRFFAAAAHAKAAGKSNPAGLFATLVRRGLWHYITQRDEDAASQKLKRLDTRLESLDVHLPAKTSPVASMPLKGHLPRREPAPTEIGPAQLRALIGKLAAGCAMKADPS